MVSVYKAVKQEMTAEEVEGVEHVKSSQVTFIYIAPLTIQIITKHCTISK